jgi:hypothetical protein
MCSTNRQPGGVSLDLAIIAHTQEGDAKRLAKHGIIRISYSPWHGGEETWHHVRQIIYDSARACNLSMTCVHVPALFMRCSPVHAPLDIRRHVHAHSFLPSPCDKKLVYMLWHSCERACMLFMW